MLNDQKGSSLFNREKTKERWKQNPEKLYRRDKKMTDTFEDYQEEEDEILEREVKAVLKVLGRNRAPGVDGIPTDFFSSHRDRICQNPNKSMSTNIETKQ